MNFYVKTTGANNIIVADVIEERLDLAEKMGANVTINSSKRDLLEEVMKITGGIGVACLMEASGNQEMVNSCAKMLRKVILLTNLKQEINTS